VVECSSRGRKDVNVMSNYKYLTCWLRTTEDKITLTTNTLGQVIIKGKGKVLPLQVGRLRLPDFS
jgi:hypothetical protein